MGKHAAGTHNRPAAGHRSFALRPATVILSGAVCAAVVGTTPAVADDRPVGTPVGALPALPGAQGLAPGSGPLDTWAFGAPTLAQADVLAQVYTGAPGPARTVLESLGYAPVEVATTPAATPITEPEPAPPAVADPLPGNQVRIGSIQVERPDFIPPDIAAQINDIALTAETGLSDALDTTGMDPARSDVIAEKVIGDAAIGAMVGNTLSSPISSAGAMVGAMAGFIAGIPFLPAGLVVMPVIGAVMGYAFVAAPAVAAGALIGGAVGAIEGSMVPLESDLPAPPPTA
ncbi:MAG TPA: hypothetical protein VK083_22850 [Nocardia sp.]|uniref:hypothetical protein n=1 Tax=Nocardia sp. TaxID=1821 RepID=UPI002B4AD055|nr:hypothetical protein [Nocardia sp.]HLS79632.1 hypothetical protein [Nocardia sp.]